ncbi:MAG: hypothetical protein QXK33_03075 [Candidatus Bathyarchaeia archaeon]
MFATCELPVCLIKRENVNLKEKIYVGDGEGNPIVSTGTLKNCEA